MFNFFIAALVVALAPGPDNLFVLAQSATHGARAGFSVICGLCTGICVQTVLLIVGVSALIAASPIAFFVLQSKLLFSQPNPSTSTPPALG